jgi:hypothetical protein
MQEGLDCWETTKEAALEGWLEEFPALPNPSDEQLRHYFINGERICNLRIWLENHPGEAWPEDYAAVDKWAAEFDNALEELGRSRSRGGKLN